MLDMRRSKNIKSPFPIDEECDNLLVGLLSDLVFVNCYYIGDAFQMTENADTVTKETIHVR